MHLINIRNKGGVVNVWIWHTFNIYYFSVINVSSNEIFCIERVLYCLTRFQLDGSLKWRYVVCGFLFNCTSNFVLIRIHVDSLKEGKKWWKKTVTKWWKSSRGVIYSIHIKRFKVNENCRLENMQEWKSWNWRIRTRTFKYSGLINVHITL